MSTETEPGHGNSPAAWTAVVIMLVGVTVGTLAFWFDFAWLVWVSVAVVVIGAIIGVVLARVGFGVSGPRYAPKKHD
jgi:uncharacterized protein (DUF983 family)